jgi:hypothetical protein
MVTRDMLSPYCGALIGDGAGKHIEIQKLIPNLRSKRKFITHCRNLKLYPSLGIKSTKVYRVVKFSPK